MAAVLVALLPACCAAWLASRRCRFQLVGGTVTGRHSPAWHTCHRLAIPCPATPPEPGRGGPPAGHTRRRQGKRAAAAAPGGLGAAAAAGRHFAGGGAGGAPPRCAGLRDALPAVVPARGGGLLPAPAGAGGEKGGWRGWGTVAAVGRQRLWWVGRGALGVGRRVMSRTHRRAFKS